MANPKITPKIIQIGSKVKVKSDSDRHEFILVYPYQAKVENGKLSCESPLGNALLGCQEGERVEVKISPREKIYYLIEEVE